MSTVPVASYLLLILLSGYATVSALAPGRRHWADLLGACYAAGYGTVGWVLTVVSMGGRAPDRAVLCGAAAIAVAAVVGLARARRLATPVAPAWPRVGLGAVPGCLGLVALGAAVLNVAVRARWPGLNHIDVFATWMFKAKAFALQPLRPVPAALADPGLSYSHQDYPPTVPMVTAGLYAALGRVDVEAAKALLLPTYLALAAVLYGGARSVLGRGMALALVAAAAGGPDVIQYATLQVAEAPLLLMLAAAVGSLAGWARSTAPADLALVTLFAAFAGLVKNEGLALMPAWTVIVAVVAWQRMPAPCRWTRLKRIGRSAWPASVVAAVTLLPWLTYRAHLPHTHEDYGGRLTDPVLVAHRLGRLWPAAKLLIPRALDVRESGLFWRLFGLVVLATAPFGRPTAPLAAVWAVLAAQLTLLLASLAVSPWDTGTLVALAGSRLLAQTVPAATLVIAMSLHSVGVGRPHPAIAVPDP